MRTERYEAVVSSNEDEEQRGRIQVTCPALLGDDITVLPCWLEPIHDWGWFYVPDVGEQVEIEIAASDELDETFGQTFPHEFGHVARAGRYFLREGVDFFTLFPSL